MAVPNLGALKVSGQLLLGYADSADSDTIPDVGVPLGTVLFEPVIEGNDPLVYLATGAMVRPIPIVATIRSDGYVAPPADGISSDPAPADMDPVTTPEPVTKLIAPEQGFNIQGWSWRATFKPRAIGPTFPQFTRLFTGAPDQSIDLGLALSATPTKGVTPALVYDVDTIAEPYPTGFRPGIDFLLTPDQTLWSVN